MQTGNNTKRYNVATENAKEGVGGLLLGGKNVFKVKKSSSINLKWLKDGEDIDFAMVGEKVMMLGEVKNIPDGEQLPICLFEKDYNTDDDPIDEKQVVVKDGKVEWEWAFEYVEDNDDVDSEEELEEKGYTKPEYAFKIDSERFDLRERSPVLEMKDWFEVQVDEIYIECGFKKYVVHDGNGNEIVKGDLNDDGSVKIELGYHKEYYIFFPEMDEELDGIKKES